jgi:hypothetical protein
MRKFVKRKRTMIVLDRFMTVLRPETFRDGHETYRNNQARPRMVRDGQEC